MEVRFAKGIGSRRGYEYLVLVVSLFDGKLGRLIFVVTSMRVVDEKDQLLVESQMILAS